MKCEIEKADGPCPFCPKPRGKVFFQIECENFKGRVCAAHLASILDQAKPKDVPAGLR